MAAAAFLIKILEEVKKDTHSATIPHWTRRFWKVSTGGTWWKVKGSAQKCQGSPSVIVQSFFTPVLWIDCGCFQSIPHRRLWKNIDTWTFYNLWRKKVEICWPLPPEPRAIELLTEPQCLLKPAHCECKMTFTDTSPFSVCCCEQRINVCLWQWRGGLSGLRSQVGICKTVRYDGTLMDIADGMKCGTLIQTQFSHVFASVSCYSDQTLFSPPEPVSEAPVLGPNQQPTVLEDVS